MAAKKDTTMKVGEMEAAPLGAGAGAGEVEYLEAMDGATKADATMTAIMTMAMQLNLASIVNSLIG